MDRERGDRRGDRPDRELERFDHDAVLLKEALDQEDRGNGNEDIFTEKESDIVGGYEYIWALLRARYGKDRMPRTVNTITGPSRTGDVELTMQLGAHGPRSVQVILVGA